jgi:acetyltransferase-like isoleucine patch superfamily enzyme
MKRRMFNILVRLFQFVRILLYDALSTGHSKGHAHKMQPVLILGKGVVEFEKGVTLGYYPSPFFLNGHMYIEARNQGAFIIIGENTHINNNFVSIAEYTSIRIGKRCFIGSNVEILDSNFHGLRVSERSTSKPENAKPVVICDDVFIGSNVKIMKGVVVGSGSIISNGSIVVGSIPPNVIAGGNPAKVLKDIKE